MLVLDNGEVREATAEEIAEIEARREQTAAPTVPAQVTMRQAQLALLAAGKLSAVDAALDNLPSPQREIAQVEWRAARDVERASPIVALVGPLLEMDDAALDALFVDAATR